MCRMASAASGNAITAGDFGHRRTGTDFHDTVIALLHDAQLHEHGPASRRRETITAGMPRRRCQASVRVREASRLGLLPGSVPVIRALDALETDRLIPRPPEHASGRLRRGHAPNAAGWRGTDLASGEEAVCSTKVQQSLQTASAPSGR